jgi:hypothetical protein
MGLALLCWRAVPLAGAMCQYWHYESVGRCYGHYYVSGPIWFRPTTHSVSIGRHSKPDSLYSPDHFVSALLSPWDLGSLLVSRAIVTLQPFSQARCLGHAFVTRCREFLIAYRYLDIGLSPSLSLLLLRLGICIVVNPRLCPLISLRLTVLDRTRRLWQDLAVSFRVLDRFSGL